METNHVASNVSLRYKKSILYLTAVWIFLMYGYHVYFIQKKFPSPLANSPHIVYNERKNDRSITMQTHFDVIVCGGGIAGIASALAAAREGASVCLLEKEYTLGGLATVGLIVIYLPLCDGDGVLMSGGITEELALASLKYGPGTIPEVWKNRANTTTEERAGKRYEIRYQAAPMMLAAEELLLDAGVTIYYDARLASAQTSGDKVTSVVIDTKAGPVTLDGKAFVDATGDADLCFFAGEKTVSFDQNSRTGWYFSFDGTTGTEGKLELHLNSDGYYPAPAEGLPRYHGLDAEDISRHMIDMHKMILADAAKRQVSNPKLFPLLIPSFHGLRTTRRLATSMEFSEDNHERVWFTDAIGMIGNWKKSHLRYSIPYRCCKAETFGNLYAAGRCVSADRSGWDLTRVIPTCAVTGEAVGIAAAVQAKTGTAPTAAALQDKLRGKGVPLDPALFDRTID